VPTLPSAIVDPLAVALAPAEEADVDPCAAVAPLPPDPLDLVPPGAPLACAGDAQGTVVVVVLVVVDDDFAFGFVVDVVAVDGVDEQGLPPVLPPNAWAPVPPVPTPDPAPMAEPWTIGRCAASAIAWSDCLLPHPVKTRAAQAKEMATIDAGRPVSRTWVSLRRIVVPAQEPPSCIVLKLPPPCTGPPRKRTNFSKLGNALL
jgi:hypothetical protein